MQPLAFRYRFRPPGSPLRKADRHPRQRRSLGTKSWGSRPPIPELFEQRNPKPLRRRPVSISFAANFVVGRIIVVTLADDEVRIAAIAGKFEFAAAAYKRAG
jgi:hypothetical protein